MKKILLLSLLTVTAALPAPALAEPGEFDESFGFGGKVATDVNFSDPWSWVRVQVAEAPDGGILVAGDAKIARYLPDGRLDPSFGRGGIRQVEVADRRNDPENLRLRIADLGVDGEGRVILVGTAGRTGNTSPPPHPSFATVLRYLPNGELDPSFGGGDGIVVADFGLPPAPGSRVHSVTATLGAVDAGGRITLIAGTRQRGSRCGAQPDLLRRDRLIVRLTPEGTLDRSFGDRGTQDIEPLETITTMALHPNGGIVLAGVPRGCAKGPRTALIRLHSNGSRLRWFGLLGTLRLTGAVASIAIDPRRRIVVLFQSRQLRARDEQATKVMRLLPDGGFDPEFEDGYVIYTTKGPRYRWNTAAIRPDGKPILVGTLIRPLAKGFHRWFLAVPLRDSGRLEDNLSWRGWAWITRFDESADAAASEALIDSQGRLLIAGTARWPRFAPRGGFALARFELDSR
ncbi:MAG TPA: hypothetical protein VHH14_04005 [Solirubrobacterales bacterium]|nr:hypothetical protein [Solirubrobacterales bacterium]